MPAAPLMSGRIFGHALTGGGWRAGPHKTSSTSRPDRGLRPRQGSGPEGTAAPGFTERSYPPPRSAAPARSGPRSRLIRTVTRTPKGYPAPVGVGACGARRRRLPTPPHCHRLVRHHPLRPCCAEAVLCGARASSGRGKAGTDVHGGHGRDRDITRSVPRAFSVLPVRDDLRDSPHHQGRPLPADGRVWPLRCPPHRPTTPWNSRDSGGDPTRGRPDHGAACPVRGDRRSPSVHRSPRRDLRCDPHSFWYQGKQTMAHEAGSV